MRWFVLFLLWSSLASGGEIPREIAATVWLRSGNHSVGTGWIVDTERRWLLTARHVVGDRDAVEAFFVEPSATGWKALRRDYLEQQAALRHKGLIVPGKVIARHNTADLALVQLDQLPPNSPALPLASRVRLGDSIRLIGHRFDAETLWTAASGVVRQTGTFREGYFWNAQKLGVAVPVVVAQLPIEAGDSGAAVLNANGEVIGLVSAFSNRVPGASIAIDVSVIQTFLAETRKNKAPATLPTQPNIHVQRLQRATAWLSPQATNSRSAAVVIDRERRLLLTSCTATGTEDRVTLVFSTWHDDRLRAESEFYQDLLGLRLTQQCVMGFVLARDPKRDLALLQVEHLPATVSALAIAKHDAKQGDLVHTMNHPLGLELLWLYAAGRVRATAALALQSDAKEGDRKPLVSLVQLPHQASSSGGGLTNDDGELVGIVSHRENPRHELGYAVATHEIRAFLNSAAPLAYPKSAQDYVACAEHWIQHSRPAEAAQAFQQASRLAPRDQLLRLRTARALANNQQQQESRKMIEGISPQSADEYALLGHVLLALGDAKKAAPLFDKSLQADGKCVLAYMGRGAIREGAEALADLNEASFLAPNYPEAYALRARKHDPRDPHSSDRVLRDLSRVLELRPYDRAARAARAAQYVERNEGKKALADWQRIVEHDDLDVAARYCLGQLQLRFGKEDDACTTLIAILRIRPTEMSSLGKLVLQHGRTLAQANSEDERINGWYETILRAMLPWASPKQRESIREWLAIKEANANARRKRFEDALSTLK